MRDGTQLAHYTILARIGAGAMGEVYRARDVQLDREVALKILPPEVGDDPERVARFAREARTLAALNHPGIAQIHGFSEAEGIRFLVMEYVAGEDLQARLQTGPLPLEEGLTVAAAIAAGLEAAHRAGVVHRDLKPANVKVTPEGSVKILDFGLARALDAEPGTTDPASSPTLTRAMTAPGLVLGTAAYMSPEQARGRRVDQRADLWALGVLMYEMFTGRRLFATETVSDTLAAVLRADLDLSALPADLPAGARRLIVRCLQRDPQWRQRDAGDARLDLLTTDPAGPDGAAADGAAPVPPWRRRPAWILATILLLGLGLGALGGRWFAPPVPDDREAATWRALEVAGPYFVDPAGLAIRDDGRQVVYTQNGPEQPLLVLDLDGSRPRPVPGSEGGRSPVYAPGGRSIAYFTPAGLFRCDLDGTRRRQLFRGTAPIAVAQWVDPDTVHVSLVRLGQPQQEGVIAIAADGSGRRVVSRPDHDAGEVAHLLTDATPDGRFALVAVLAGADIGYRVHRQDLRTGTLRPLADWSGLARWSPTGHLLLADRQRDALRAIPYDLDRLESTGVSVELRRGLGMPDVAAFGLDVSDEGTVVFGASASDLPTATVRSVQRLDPAGEVRPLPIEEGPWADPRPAPDGQRLLLRRVAEACDLWVADTATGAMVRVTFDGDDHDPCWLPDGGLAYVERGIDRQTVKVFDQVPGPERALAGFTDVGVQITDVTPDGSALVVHLSASPRQEAGIFLMPLVPAGDPAPGPRPWLVREQDDSSARISPDGSWVAHVTRTERGPRIFLRRLDDPATVVQVSDHDARAPFWSQDGSRLHYVSEGELMACDVDTDGGLAISAPRVIHAASPAAGLGNGYAAAAEGVVMLRFAGDPGARERVTFLTGLAARVRQAR